MIISFQVSSGTYLVCKCKSPENAELYSTSWSFCGENVGERLKHLGNYDVYECDVEDPRRDVYFDNHSNGAKLFHALHHLKKAYIVIKKSPHIDKNDFWIVKKLEDGKYMTLQRFEDIWKHEVDVEVDV